jgi:type VI secretion system protein ImpL
MSSHGDQLKSALGLSAVASIYGISCLVVWFLGPQFGLGYASQIIIIALILLTWPFALVINHYRKRREERREQQDAAAPAAAPATHDGKASKRQKGRTQLPPVAGTYEALTRGAEEVVQWLRGTRLSGKRGKNDAVYSLPWFLISGPPTSGKTSLIQAASLDFHTLPSQRAADQHIIRPTPNCEWRVTDSAIWLDTTGRYQTEGPDRDEWAALVETLKQYRKARPLDGLVITVNTGAVLRWNENEIEQQAKILRARLDEASLRAGVRFPVYLVFTHADAIEGFGDFFRDFGGDERTQVWGVTFPLAQAQNAHALFDNEFDHLYGRLLRRRTVQLESTARSTEQLRIFKFPGRFRRARQRLGLFTSALFRPNPFSESPLLRGFYFTSSTGQGAVNARYLSGHELFTQNLFHQVLLRDQHIVASMQAQKSHPTRLRNLLLAAAAVLLCVFLVGAIYSFFNNRELIADAQARGQELAEIRKAISKTYDDPESAKRELAAIERLREKLSELDEYERTSPPLSLRFGLYSGNKLNEEGSILRHYYIEAVEQRFLQPTFKRMTEDLRAFASGSKKMPANADDGDTSAAQGSAEEKFLEHYYDLLKAYLMLSKPEKVESSFLANELRGYWRQSAPEGRAEEAQRQLDFYASQASKADVSHPEPDMALVAQAQNKLTAYPIVSRVYKRIISDINQEIKYPVNLKSIPSAREGSDLLSSTYSVPPAYTLEGYERWRDTLKASAAEEFRRDDWVMQGTSESTDQNLDVKKEELQNIYYRNYSDQWQRFLQELRVRDYKSKEDAAQQLRRLAASSSPLDAVLREVARQTNFSGPGEGFFGWLGGLFQRKTDESKLTSVEQDFRPLILFVSGKDDRTNEYRTKLNGVGEKLHRNSNPLAKLSQLLQADNDALELNTARKDIETLLDNKNFNRSPASLTAAKVMRQPLDNLYTLLVGTDFEQIDKLWQTLYAKSWLPLESRYPFADGGTSGDASVADIAKFLNPANGELTTFFNQRLKPYFEEDWSPKPEGSERFTPEFVAFLKNARRLRDALFPAAGNAPNVEYQIGLTPVRDALTRVEIDGNVLEQDKPAPQFRWPGNKSGVKITMTFTGGPYTTQTAEKIVTGEWGLLKMFTEGGGGDGKAAQFNLALTATTPAAASSSTLAPTVGGGGRISVPVRLTIQPKSGTIFQRELFTSLRGAPKRLIQPQSNQ